MSENRFRVDYVMTQRDENIFGVLVNMGMSPMQNLNLQTIPKIREDVLEYGRKAVSLIAGYEALESDGTELFERQRKGFIEQQQQITYACEEALDFLERVQTALAEMSDLIRAVGIEHGLVKE